MGQNSAQKFNVCWNLWHKKGTALMANYAFFGHIKLWEGEGIDYLALKLSSLKAAANRLLALFNIRPICG
jgi:hypothetical protein